MDYTESLVRHLVSYDGLITKTYLDRVRLPNGEDSMREVIDHPGGVAVIPVDEDGTVYCVRQYRYAIGKHLLEIPAGKIEKAEQPLQCAIRELSEETGIEAEEFVELGQCYPSPGYCREALYIFLARKLTFREPHPDNNEFLDIEKHTLDDLTDMAMNGEITDGKTIIGILKAKRYFEERK